MEQEECLAVPQLESKCRQLLQEAEEIRLFLAVQLSEAYKEGLRQ